MPHMMHVHKTYRLPPQVEFHDIDFQLTPHSTSKVSQSSPNVVCPLPICFPNWLHVSNLTRQTPILGIRRYIFRVFTPWHQSIVEVKPVLLSRYFVCLPSSLFCLRSFFLLLLGASYFWCCCLFFLIGSFQQEWTCDAECA